MESEISWQKYFCFSDMRNRQWEVFHRLSSSKLLKSPAKEYIIKLGLFGLQSGIPEVKL